MKCEYVLQKNGFIAKCKMKYWNERALHRPIRGANMIAVQFLLEIGTFIFVIDFNRMSLDKNGLCLDL